MARKKPVLPGNSAETAIFLKKIKKIFASSDFVATFASAFEKSTFFTKSQNIPQGIRAGPQGRPETWKECRFFGKMRSFCKKACRIEKVVLPLQSFRATKRGFFQHGSLNYWSKFERKEM